MIFRCRTIQCTMRVFAVPPSREFVAGIFPAQLFQRSVLLQSFCRLRKFYGGLCPLVTGPYNHRRAKHSRPKIRSSQSETKLKDWILITKSKTVSFENFVI